MNIINKTILNLAGNIERKRDMELKDYCWNNCIVAEGKAKGGALTFTEVAKQFGVTRQKVVAVCLEIAEELDEVGRDNAAYEAKRDAADIQAEIKAALTPVEVDNAAPNA